MKECHASAGTDMTSNDISPAYWWELRGSIGIAGILELAMETSVQKLEPIS